MKWVKVKDGFPKVLKTVLVEYYSGDYERIKYSGKLDNWWMKNINVWLDDTEPSFTIEDMNKCWNKCDVEHGERSGCGLPRKLFKMFMKDKYNIEITNYE